MAHGGAMVEVNGMPHAKAIETSMLRFLREDLGVEVPSADTNLIDAGVLDSLMLVDLVMHIEEQFRVTSMLEDLDLENFATVANMASFVSARAPAVGPIGQ